VKGTKGTAYHEAGHAVAAISQRLRVKTISIIPDKSRGTLEWYSAGRVDLEDVDYGDKGIIVLLAGLASQKKHVPTSIRRFSGVGDLEGAKSLACLGDGTEYSDQKIRTMLEQRWNRLQEETRNLVNANSAVIVAVAQRLLEVGEMKGTELLPIFRQNSGVRWNRSRGI
jgi:ATP-dependent Zn protease